MNSLTYVSTARQRIVRRSSLVPNLLSISVSLLYPSVFFTAFQILRFACCCFPDVRMCKDNVYFTDRQGRICSSYQELAINCSHEIMSEDNYAGVVENCPLSCGLCEGRSLYMLHRDRPPVLHLPYPIHIERSIMSNSYVGPPTFPALWFLCVSFCGVPVQACISFTFDVSAVFCVFTPPLLMQTRRRRAGVKFPFPQKPLRKERRSACLRIRCNCKVQVNFGTSGQFKRGMPVSSSWTREAMAK